MYVALHNRMEMRENPFSMAAYVSSADLQSSENRIDKCSLHGVQFFTR